MARSLFLIAALIAAPAAAQTAAAPVVMTTVTSHLRGAPAILVPVTAADRADGGTALKARLWRAARDVCRLTQLRDLSESRLEGACRADALARARAAVPAALAGSNAIAVGG
jgi:UrcA family protein